jgi:hypothetical protein
MSRVLEKYLSHVDDRSYVVVEKRRRRLDPLYRFALALSPLLAPLVLLVLA